LKIWELVRPGQSGCNLEGYTLGQRSGQARLWPRAEVMRRSVARWPLTSSDAFSCVERHRQASLELVDAMSNLLFANEGRIMALLWQLHFERLANNVRGRCQVRATRSKRDSVRANRVSTTGDRAYRSAHWWNTHLGRDLYAAVFLFGHTRGDSLERCGTLGIPLCLAR